MGHDKTAQRPTSSADWHVGGDVAAQARSVPHVRHAIGAMLQRYGAPRETLGKVELAVSEAAANVVLHAYDGRGVPGQLHYDADITDGGLEVVVTDDGGGLRDDHHSDGLGLGLKLIAAVSDDFAVTQRRFGLEVWMRFALDA